MILATIDDELAVAGRLARLHRGHILRPWAEGDVDGLQDLTIAVAHLNRGLAHLVAHVDEVTIELVISKRDERGREERGRVGGSSHKDEPQQ